MGDLEHLRSVSTTPPCYEIYTLDSAQHNCKQCSTHHRWPVGWFLEKLPQLLVHWFDPTSTPETMSVLEAVV